ncbi:hypothetical protein BGZ63DRAFT_35833 [Mariannaea sp. PMI_226]|nr:hypothetical protein BGZ63DRAFT_35833 [Mariannaea sp. PMI_226]
MAVTVLYPIALSLTRLVQVLVQGLVQVQVVLTATATATATSDRDSESRQSRTIVVGTGPAIGHCWLLPFHHSISTFTKARPHISCSSLPILHISSRYHP